MAAELLDERVALCGDYSDVDAIEENLCTLLNGWEERSAVRCR